ncbi:MAG: hypothetical protein O3B27_06375 [Actinomycetota bacterium]|nr:hypothetical protein [Actinomycetota bacterium]MDA2949941.1 hypothetical protein [Actinomycetota bacterium]MDA2991163.1 hypothetical protein [Actinomycetota bacterium]
MRHLTAAGAAAVLLAAGIGAAPSAAADPTMTDPTNSEVATAAPAEPAGTEPTDPESASTEPTSAESTGTESTGTEPEGARQVTYTVTTTSDLTANIYYVTADPPAQSEANDPEYMPMARTMVGPGAPWTFQTTLEDPTQWAFVSASGGLRVNPEFRCEIAVDGQVVVSQQGGSGVQCALRPW